MSQRKAQCVCVYFISHPLVCSNPAYPNITFYIHSLQGMHATEILGEIQILFLLSEILKRRSLSRHRGEAIYFVPLMTRGSLSHGLTGTIMNSSHWWGLEARVSSAPHCPAWQPCFCFCCTPEFVTQGAGMRKVRTGLRTRGVMNARGCVENLKLPGWQEPFSF